jgi:hypothetical protein
MTTKNKHIPQRTCIACRQSKAKKDLIRVICTNDGVVEVDLSSKKPGRGAYLCPKRDCWEMGLKGNHLERALRTKLSSDSRQALIEYSKSLP